MSRPQNNLEDLKRKAHTGPTAGQETHSREEAQPKVRLEGRRPVLVFLHNEYLFQNFKFKATARPPQSQTPAPLRMTFFIILGFPHYFNLCITVLSSKTASAPNFKQRSLTTQVEPAQAKPQSQVQPKHKVDSLSVSIYNSSFSPRRTSSSASVLASSSSPSNAALKRSTSQVENDVIASGGSNKRVKVEGVKDENGVFDQYQAYTG